jgi:nucleotide-binding universal stress UspA family protein
MSTKIMVPVSGSAASLKAVEEAIKLARDYDDALIQLVNVQPAFHRHIARHVKPGDLDGMRTDRARRALHAALWKVRAAGVPSESYMLRGRPCEAIAAFASSQRVSSIVMTTPEASGWFRKPLAARVIAAADAPVEVVNTGPASPLERFGLPAGLGIGLTMAWLAVE